MVYKNNNTGLLFVLNTIGLKLEELKFHSPEGHWKGQERAELASLSRSEV